MTASDITERLDLSTIAYNAGLEIRYAIAASGLDPIHHIPEVDRIIERRLAEATAAAMERAAQIIDEGFDRGIKHKRETCAHGKFGWEDCEQCCSAAIRQAGKDGGAG